MSRSIYYEEMKELACNIRHAFGLIGPRVLRSDMRRIYREYEIQIDLWPYKVKKLRGAYFNDENGCSVLLAKGLPEDPMVFTMAHELKHHLVDRNEQTIICDESNQNEVIEIGAEVFAAEFLFPDDIFIASMKEMGISEGECHPKTIVTLKRNSKTTLSFTGLAKKAEFLGFADKGVLEGVHWKKLEISMYGEPFYKRMNKFKKRIHVRK